MSGAATRDKHRVPDGKLLERNKINICMHQKFCCKNSILGDKHLLVC